jgi:purine catabolism regulator
VSGPADLDDLDRAHREASTAAETAATAAGRTGAVVVRFADLTRPGLVELLPAATAAAFSTDVLAPLRAPGIPADLLDAVRVWLAHHGQWDPAATVLGVHRHTLRKRIRRAEELIGRDLDSPGVRAELWLALHPPST